MPQKNDQILFENLAGKMLQDFQVCLTILKPFLVND